MNTTSTQDREERAVPIRLLRELLPALLPLAVNRALFVTIAIAALAVILLLLDQPAEVLYSVADGFAEAQPTRRESWVDELSSQIPQRHLGTAYLSFLLFWAGSVICALVVNHAVRLAVNARSLYARRDIRKPHNPVMSPLYAAADTPYALSRRAARADRLARFLLPGLLGLLAVALLMGSYLHASLVPGQRWTALLCAAWLLLPMSALRVTGALRRCALALLLAGLLSLLALPLLALLMSGTAAFSEHLWLSCTLSAATPALLWQLMHLRARRAMLVKLRCFRRPRHVLRVTIAAVLVVLGVWVAAQAVPVSSLTKLGSLSLLLWAMCAALLALSAVDIALRVGLPSPLLRRVAAGSVIAVVVVFLDMFPEAVGNETLPVSEPGASVPRIPPAPLPPVQFALHADGGGLRAALFTARVLALLDDATCGAFGERVLAASGVSGGSLGIAAWMVAREEYLRHAQQRAWENCQRDAAVLPPDAQCRDPAYARNYARVTNMRDGPLSAIVNRMLATDHLSPVLASMLRDDGVARWRGEALRGQALLDSWQSALKNALAASGYALAGPVFAAPLSRISGGMTRPPALMFSSTDAASGRPIVFSNSEVFPMDSNIAIGVAALHSARFPIVSPAGVARSRAQTQHTVVDGGYFDNSGATALLAYLEGTAVSLPPEPLKIVRINGNSDETASRCRALLGLKSDRPPLLGRALRWSPIDTYGQLRRAHTEAAVDRLAEFAQRLSAQASANPRLEDSADARAVVLNAMTLNYEAGVATRFVLPEDGRQGPEPEFLINSFHARNRDICLDAVESRRAPLGWLVTPESSRRMNDALLASAVTLLRSIDGWPEQPNCP